MFKVVVLGEGGIGKTTLLEVIRKNVVDLRTIQMTIGVQFHDIQIYYNRDKVGFQVWDFGGEDRFKFLIKSYAQGSSGGIFMFDLTNYDSLINIITGFQNLENTQIIYQF